MVPRTAGFNAKSSEECRYSVPPRMGSSLTSRLDIDNETSECFVHSAWKKAAVHRRGSTGLRRSVVLAGSAISRVARDLKGSLAWTRGTETLWRIAESVYSVDAENRDREMSMVAGRRHSMNLVERLSAVGRWVYLSFWNPRRDRRKASIALHLHNLR